MKMLSVMMLFLVNWFACADNSGDFSIPDNPAEIFNHGLSHGIGESLLDSPFLQDSLNALILIASRNGISQEQLQRKLSETENLSNRVNSLLQAKILLRQQNQYYCSFPILVGEGHSQYFQLVDQTVDKIYPEILPTLNNLISKVDRRGWTSWSYHMIWSLIFDSQFIWYEMVNRDVVPALAPPVEWVIYPQHPYKTGTNYYPDTELKEHWVVVSWSPNGRNTIVELGGRWKAIYDLAVGEIDSISEQNKKSLTQLGLMNERDEATFPVISSEDSLFSNLKNAANIYLDLLQRQLPIDSFQEIIKRDKKLSWAIAYHDICWEILKRLARNDIIARPISLQSNNASSESTEMTGVCSVISVYQPFIDQIMKAFAD